MKTHIGKSTTVLIVGVALAVLAACSDPFQVIEEVEFASSLGIDLADFERLESGVYIQDVELGTGPELVYGSDINVTWTGWLADGAVFNDGTFTDQVLEGSGAIIGFNIGLLGMQEGGIRRIIVPPELGYGDREDPVVPPGSVLVFEVTLNELTLP